MTPAGSYELGKIERPPCRHPASKFRGYDSDGNVLHLCPDCGRWITFVVVGSIGQVKT